MQDNPNDSSDKPQPDRKPLQKVPEKTRSLVQYSGIAFQMLATIGLGVWAGQKLDEWQQTSTPYYTIALSLVAIGASLYLFIRQLTDHS